MSSANQIQIINMALQHLGVGVGIASIDERSASARSAKLFYPTALDHALRSYRWPFADKFAALELVAEDPVEEWGFSYEYPNDCVYAHRIQSGTPIDTPETEIKFKVVGKRIYTNQEDAILEYTSTQDDTHLFPADFTMALSYLLASLMAPAISEGDPFKLGERNQRLYIQALRMASANSHNEERKGPDAESSLAASRR